jgi:hypothetical protein
MKLLIKILIVVLPVYLMFDAMAQNDCRYVTKEKTTKNVQLNTDSVFFNYKYDTINVIGSRSYFYLRSDTTKYSFIVIDSTENLFYYSIEKDKYFRCIWKP